MKITYLGHFSYFIETQNTKILFDPYITENELAKNVNISEIIPDYILLSHAHSDHIGDTLEMAKNSNPKIIAMYEVANWLISKGAKNVIPMNIGGIIKLPFGELRMVSALHSSSLPDGTYGGNPAGFVIKNQEKSFYYAGDTGLSMEMKLLKELYTLDFAILPIGGHFTMNAEDATIAAEFVGTEEVYAAHYDTFPPIKIDKKEALLSFHKKNINLHFLEINQTIEL